MPKLKRLTRYPPVAILYVTYNDAVPKALIQLKNQRYKNYQIFVLDDSNEKKYKKMIDYYGYRTIRRKNRSGFKAGAINNWLSIYGKKFDYFIVLDSDSIIDENFIENMVKYGEHPENKNIAIFQSKLRIWNTANRFPRIIGYMMPVWQYPIEKLANLIDSPFLVGHNILCRTRLIQKINVLPD